MTDFSKTTHRSVSWIKRAIDADVLEVKPPYQRNPVWLDPQKSSLIDTILLGYPIPELYMQDVVDPAGAEKHYVVDGQQRIRACIEYIEGAFEIDAAESPNYGEMLFDDLGPGEKKRIWEYSFVVRILPEASEDELRDVFKRLNRYNMALNKQELRHATYWGEFITTMEELAQHAFWVSAGIFSANDFRRMLDVEFISELTIAVLHGPQNKKASLDRWYQTYEEEFEDKTLIEEAYEKVVAVIEEILPDLRTTRWRRTSDFYTLFTTLASHREDLPLTGQSAALARAKLLEFGQEVTAALMKEPPVGTKLSRPAKLYAEAVLRAASDLARRNTRSEILEKLLADCW
jgi:hypothetical protein